MKVNIDDRNERALRLIDRLIKVSPDPGLQAKAIRMRKRLQLLPMQDVLAKVPGESVASKCRLLGITRQNYYAWLNGAWRPGQEQSRLLAKITGYDVGLIRGNVVANALPR